MKTRYPKTLYPLLLAMPGVLLVTSCELSSKPPQTSRPDAPLPTGGSVLITEKDVRPYCSAEGVALVRKMLDGSVVAIGPRGFSISRDSGMTFEATSFTHPELRNSRVVDVREAQDGEWVLSNAVTRDIGMNLVQDPGGLAVSQDGGRSFSTTILTDPRVGDGGQLGRAPDGRIVFPGTSAVATSHDGSNYRKLDPASSGLPNGPAFAALYHASTSRFWILYNGGAGAIARSLPGDDEHYEHSISGSLYSATSPTTVTRLFSIPNSDRVLGVAQAGVVLYDANAKILEAHFPSTGLPASRVRNAAYDTSSATFILLTEKGIFLKSGADAWINLPTPLPVELSSGITPVLGETGRYWISGLNKIYKFDLKSRTVLTALPWSGSTIYELVTHNGDLIASTDRGVVQIANGQVLFKKATMALLPVEGQPYLLLSGNTVSILDRNLPGVAVGGSGDDAPKRTIRLRNGGYASATSFSVAIFDSARKHVRTYFLRAKGRMGAMANDVAEADDGTLYVASPLGIFALSPGAAEFEIYPQFDTVYGSQASAAQLLWIDRSHSSVARAEGLWAIGPTGIVWFGSRGTRHFTAQKDGLPSDKISHIEMQGDRLYLSSEKGTAVYELPTEANGALKKIAHYHELNGLPSNITGYTHAVSDSEFYIATLQGIAFTRDGGKTFIHRFHVHGL